MCKTLGIAMNSTCVVHFSSRALAILRRVLMYSSLSIGGTLDTYYMRTLWSQGEHCVGRRPITDHVNVHDIHEELSRRNCSKK